MEKNVINKRHLLKQDFYQWQDVTLRELSEEEWTEETKVQERSFLFEQ